MNFFQAKRAPYLLFGFALLIGLGFVFVGWRMQGMVDARPDPYWFAAMGRSMARGEGFSAYGTLLHRRAPLYPLFIAAVFKLFGEHEPLVQLFQVLFFAGTCFLVYDLGRRIFNVRVGIIAALGCALHPALLRYVPDFHLETLFTFLFTASVWLSVRLAERPSLRRAAEFGVVAGLCALTKTVAILYPVVFLTCWWFSRQSSARRIGFGRAAVPAFLLLACMAATIAPWTVRNYLVTGHVVPVSTGFSDAFLRGYVFSKTDYVTLRRPPYTDGENESNAMFKAICAAEGAVWEQDDYQTDQILNRAAKARLLASPAAFIRKTAVGVFSFWYEMTSLPNSLVAGVMALVAWLLAFVGLPRARSERKQVWLLLAPILYFNLLLAPLLALGRYSVPVLPCLSILAAFGIETLWQKRTQASSAPVTGD